MKNTKLLTLIAVMSALAFVLYLVEIPVGFLFPAAPFLKIDFSDVPAILLSISYGPFVGVVVALFKNILHFIFKSETPLASGEIANFFAGIAFLLPYSIYLMKNRVERLNTKSMVLFYGLGTVLSTLVMIVINYYISLPLYGIPADQRWMYINAINPFNVFKGILMGLTTILIYPRLKKFLKA